ncbi:type II toxin-antitoxin system HipA family toxin [Polaribacter porphyrae]|uniref:Toxin HipA n=1 Tax=Polaribacter porphyrae TaxID=1137780 RepID=A0A2S7WMW4_9FLAO|nr:type II toxin-antitoxin system HipA family toxin [Polaribacter porphyrae]PQJ78955.1 toxin HipA [Polaribacter porphyrae]
MITTAFIKLWGKTVGAIAWDEKQQLGFFEYDKNFLDKKIEVSPLKMPVNSAQTIFSFPELRPPKNSEFNTFKGLPGLLADTLPDAYGNQLIDVWLAQQGRPEKSMNPVEQLCFIGKRAMGALEFEPMQLQNSSNAFTVEIESLVDVARKMLHNRSQFKVNVNKQEEIAIKQIIAIGTSAGGARPKAVIAYNKKTGEVRSGQSNVPKDFEHWLIKLDGVSDVQLGDTQGYGRVEMAYYLMAKASGIKMMPCELLEENGRAHFMTKRFDRDKGNIKHHIQTFCAMKHFDFNLITSFSYEQLFQTMRELRLTYKEAEEMFRRMVFNVFAKNCDDHTKNFSFIMKQNQKWELAPAYDICFAYNPTSYWVSQHALSINGKRKDFSLDDFLKVAKSMNMKKPKQIIDTVRNVVKNWSSFADEVGVDEEKKQMISEHLLTI